MVEDSFFVRKSSLYRCTAAEDNRLLLSIMAMARYGRQLCSDTSRVAGVKSNAKYAKREASAALKMRNYQVQKREDVQFEA
jgi:hypothetical protein